MGAPDISIEPTVVPNSCAEGASAASCSNRITRTEVLAEIGEMWLTEKGMSLVALIIAITLTSLLGVGIVSFMGAKQKSLVPQAKPLRRTPLLTPA